MTENAVQSSKKNSKTIILYSDDLGKVIVAFNFAMGASAMGFEATIFFTYWGLNVLRKGRRIFKGKTFVKKMLTLLLPSGPSGLFFPRQRFSALTTWFLRKSMKKHEFLTLSDLIVNSKQLGIKFVACQSCMDLFGIDRRELIDGIEFGGVAKCLEAADNSNVSFFI